MKKLVAISFLALSCSYIVNATIPGYADKHEGSITRTHSQADDFFPSQSGTTSPLPSGMCTPTSGKTKEGIKIDELKEQLAIAENKLEKLEDQNSFFKSVIVAGSAAIPSIIAAVLLASKK